MSVCGAGFETTATALSFAVYLLGQHPDVQQKIAAEVAALGNRCAMTSRLSLQIADVPPTSCPTGVAPTIVQISIGIRTLSEH